MARRRKSGRYAAAAPKVITMTAPRQAAPIIRIAAPRAAPIAKRRRGRTSFRRRAASVGGFISQHNIDMAMGGALFGFAVKSGLVQKLPAIPLIGRTGTAALLLDYWAKHGGGQTVQRAASAAAVLAGYQLGSTGSITGLQTMGDDDGYAGQDD